MTLGSSEFRAFSLQYVNRSEEIIYVNVAPILFFGVFGWKEILVLSGLRLIYAVAMG
jgi:hypothetical protein